MLQKRSAGVGTYKRLLKFHYKSQAVRPNQHQSQFTSAPLPILAKAETKFKMKFLVVFAVVLAVAAALPQRSVDDSKNAQILRYENDNIGVDGYNFAYVEVALE